MGDLSQDFSRREFACRCGCGRDDISPALIVVLQQIRNELRRPLGIRSGVRCAAHNLREGGRYNSAHLTGKAADVEARTSGERFDLVAAALRAGVTRIGIGRNFVHLDIARMLPQEVLWLY